MVNLNNQTIPNEPMTITNLLLIHRNALDEISRNLYERRGDVEDVIADTIQDVIASLDSARDISRECNL